MKNIVRCLAIALAVTGMIATTSANGSVKTATKTSAHPAPVCPPNTGDCGLGGW
jgi:hypothetical protein